MTKKYHGWIVIEKQAGYLDHFTVQYCPDPRSSESSTRAMGYGPKGATDAVAFFEVERGIGPVKLEQTPIGLRVLTMVDEEQGS